MVQHAARARLSTAKHSKIPAAANAEVKTGDEVLFYRQGSKDCHGPFRVTSCDKNWQPLKYWTPFSKRRPKTVLRG